MATASCPDFGRVERLASNDLNSTGSGSGNNSLFARCPTMPPVKNSPTGSEASSNSTQRPSVPLNAAAPNPQNSSFAGISMPLSQQQPLHMSTSSASSAVGSVTPAANGLPVAQTAMTPPTLAELTKRRRGYTVMTRGPSAGHQRAANASGDMLHNSLLSSSLASADDRMVLMRSGSIAISRGPAGPSSGTGSPSPSALVGRSSQLGVTQQLLLQPPTLPASSGRPMEEILVANRPERAQVTSVHRQLLDLKTPSTRYSAFLSKDTMSSNLVWMLLYTIFLVSSLLFVTQALQLTATTALVVESLGRPELEDALNLLTPLYVQVSIQKQRISKGIHLVNIAHDDKSADALYLNKERPEFVGMTAEARRELLRKEMEQTKSVEQLVVRLVHNVSRGVLACVTDHQCDITVKQVLDRLEDIAERRLKLLNIHSGSVRQPVKRKPPLPSKFAVHPAKASSPDDSSSEALLPVDSQLHFLAVRTIGSLAIAALISFVLRSRNE